MWTLTCLFVTICVAYGVAPVLSGCESLTFVSRAEWGARATRGSTTMTTPVNLVFVHHTEGSFCSDRASCSRLMRAIQSFHMDDRRWDDIGYNFLIGGDGLVYEARGWDRVGAHTYGYNSRSVAFSMIGTFRTVTPSDNMVTALRNLIACGSERGKIGANYGLYGHRDATAAKDCPGDMVYNIIQTWPRWHARGTIQKYTPP